MGHKKRAAKRKKKPANENELWQTSPEDLRKDARDRERLKLDEAVKCHWLLYESLGPDPETTEEVGVTPLQPLRQPEKVEPIFEIPPDLNDTAVFPALGCGCGQN